MKHIIGVNMSINPFVVKKQQFKWKSYHLHYMREILTFTTRGFKWGELGTAVSVFSNRQKLAF